MSIWQAIILGLIQGLTEFIPISSTAHLTIAGKFMGLISPEHPEQWTAFIAVIQLGTLIAVVAYFRSEVISITRGFVLTNLAFLRRRPADESLRSDARAGWLVIAGTIPVGVAGLVFKDVIEGKLTKNLWVIAGSLIGLAVALALAEVFGRQRRGMTHMRLTDAVVVGIAQAFALIPGSSRSGTTITGGLITGLKREAAARFSFLLSIPAIAASGIFELPKALGSVSSDWLAILVATAVASVSGYLSIAFLLKFLQRHTTFLFVGYRIALGVLLIALLLAGRISGD
jgi:undecaprenyl-diphosphatase